MTPTDPTPAEAPAPRPSPLRHGWRLVKALVVAAFVTWHLFFLAYRNVADLWGDELLKKVDGPEQQKAVAEDLKKLSLVTRRYASLAGQEQGWCMFAAPLARKAYFPAVRIHFTDGSDELMTSGNEPDPNDYRRFGGWRQRKLEDTIAAGNADPTGEESALWANYTLWVYRAWRETHANDPREVKWLQLLRRQITFPEYGQPREFAEPKESEIARYTPGGRLVR